MNEGIKESTDGGNTFAPIGSGLPFAGDFGLTSLAIGTSNDPVCATAPPSDADRTLYVGIALNGASDPNNHTDMSVYKSTDGGNDWALDDTPNYAAVDSQNGSSQDQSFYDNAIAVDPCNVNHVIAGGENLIQSTDFGNSWSQVSPVHADTHAIAFEADGDAIIGCDGGVYELDRFNNVEDLNSNQDDTLVYPTLGMGGVAGQVVTLAAGLQDNGSVEDPNLGNLPNIGWNSVQGGDGGSSAIDPNDYKEQLVESDGELCLTTDNWSNPISAIECDTDQSPPGSECTPKPWFDCEEFAPPLAMTNNSSNPDQATVYFGGQGLWEGFVNNSNGVTWVNNGQQIASSPDSGRVSAIGVPPDDPNSGLSMNGNVVWVGFTDGTLEVTTDAMQSQSPSFTTIPLVASTNGQPISGEVSSISVDPSDPDTAAVAIGSEIELISGWSTPNFTITDITGDLPPGPLGDQSVAFSNGLLLAATGEGVFYTDLTDHSSGQPFNWDPIGGPQSLGSGLPNVDVNGLNVFDGQTFATTWGRGIWALSSLNQASDVQVGTTSLDDASYDEPYQASLTATGGAAGGYQWTLAPNSNPLPNGLTLSSSGQISGRPTQAGTFEFTAQVEDSWGYTATQSLAITVVEVTVSNATPGWSSLWSPVGTSVILAAQIAPLMAESDAAVTFTACPPAESPLPCLHPTVLGTVPVPSSGYDGFVDLTPPWLPSSGWVGDDWITATYTSDSDPTPGTDGTAVYTVFTPGYPIVRSPLRCGTEVVADWYSDPQQPTPPIPNVGDEIRFELQPGSKVSPLEHAFPQYAGMVQATWLAPKPGVYISVNVTDLSPSGVQPFTKSPFTVYGSPACTGPPPPPAVVPQAPNYHIGGFNRLTPIAIPVLGSVLDSDFNVNPASLTLQAAPQYGHVWVKRNAGACSVCVGKTAEFVYAPNRTALGSRGVPAPLQDSFTYRVSDLLNDQSNTATVTVSLRPNSAPTITSSGSTSFTEGAAGSFTVTATGAPTPSITETGTLPAGVSLVGNGNGTASLTGLPRPGTNGVYPLTLTASNGIGIAATSFFVLTVNSSATTPIITSSAVDTLNVGAAASFVITTTGTPAPAITESGALPAGVGLVDNSNGTGTLLGVPAPGTTGSYPLTITAANGAGVPVSQSFTLTVDPSLGSPAVTSGESASFVKGVPGSFTVTTTGTPSARITEVGSLPPGLGFSDNGNGTATIAGTPTTGRDGMFPGGAGQYVIQVTASNGIAPSATQTLTIFDNQGTTSPPAITSAGAATFEVGDAESFTVTSSGNPVPGFFEVGALPGGVTFTDNGDGTATLAGTPAANGSGSYPITIYAQSNVGSAVTQSFLLTVPPPTVAISGNPAGGGYWRVDSHGNVFPFGGAHSYGSLPGEGVSKTDVIDLVPTPGGKGYWIVDADGDVYPFGDASPSLGSLTGQGVSDIVGMTATPDGGGYWLAGSDGVIYPFGDAASHGSIGGSIDNVVAIAATPDGGGYWAVTSTGGVFTFGDASYYGAPSGVMNVTSIEMTPDGRGYWLIDADGGIHPYGDAASQGSLSGDGVSDIVGMAPTTDGNGYWLAGTDGTTYPFGDAP